MKLNLACQLTCLDHGNTNIRSDWVKVVDFPENLQNHIFGQHTREVWVFSK